MPVLPLTRRACQPVQPTQCMIQLTDRLIQFAFFRGQRAGLAAFQQLFELLLQLPAGAEHEIAVHGFDRNRTVGKPLHEFLIKTGERLRGSDGLNHGIDSLG